MISFPVQHAQTERGKRVLSFCLFHATKSSLQQEGRDARSDEISHTIILPHTHTHAHTHPDPNQSVRSSLHSILLQIEKQTTSRNPRVQGDFVDVLKIQQERERRYSKSSKRERGGTQNPAREREKDLLKIQQEKEMNYSKSSKRESRYVVIVVV